MGVFLKSQLTKWQWFEEKAPKKSFHSKIKNVAKNVVSNFGPDSFKTPPLRVYEGY